MARCFICIASGDRAQDGKVSFKFDLSKSGQYSLEIADGTAALDEAGNTYIVSPRFSMDSFSLAGMCTLQSSGTASDAGSKRNASRRASLGPCGLHCAGLLTLPFAQTDPLSICAVGKLDAYLEAYEKLSATPFTV
jgi:hypothetical protein